jgi:hypothetical protein
MGFLDDELVHVASEPQKIKHREALSSFAQGLRDSLSHLRIDPELSTG